MTKQEFAFKLLLWFFKYPLSRALPRILMNILSGLAALPPEQWAKTAYEALKKLYNDTFYYAESLQWAAEQLPPDDQLTELTASLNAALDNSLRLLDILSGIVDNLDAYTTDQLINAFNEALASLEDSSSAVDSLRSAIPSPPPIAPPVYIPPLPPLYTGPPVPGPWGPPTYPRSIPSSALPPWFYEPFSIIDPAVWTDYSSGGVNSILNNKLKMLSTQAADYAWLETGPDNTIPESFDLLFELRFVSGSGSMRFDVYDGVHNIRIIFEPPNTLRFRQKTPLGFKDINVGNFINLTYTWKFVYNGTTVDIYRGSDLIDSNLTLYDTISSPGQRILWAEDDVSVLIDDYTITPN